MAGPNQRMKTDLVTRCARHQAAYPYRYPQKMIFSMRKSRERKLRKVALPLLTEVEVSEGVRSQFSYSEDVLAPPSSLGRGIFSRRDRQSIDFSNTFSGIGVGSKKGDNQSMKLTWSSARLRRAPAQAAYAHRYKL